MVDAVVTRGFVMCLDNWENWNQGDLISDQAWSYVLKKKHTQKKLMFQNVVFLYQTRMCSLCRKLE